METYGATGSSEAALLDGQVDRGEREVVEYYTSFIDVAHIELCSNLLNLHFLFKVLHELRLILFRFRLMDGVGFNLLVGLGRLGLGVSVGGGRCHFS